MVGGCLQVQMRNNVNQRALGEDISADPLQTSFYLAMQSYEGVLLVRNHCN